MIWHQSFTSNTEANPDIFGAQNLVNDMSVDALFPCVFSKSVSVFANTCCKNIEKHTAHAIVSWPNHKQWTIFHTSDLMMIIRQIIYSLNHHKPVDFFIVEKFQTPQVMLEWLWRYRSRSKVIVHDTPSHASDHMCLICKESIQYVHTINEFAWNDHNHLYLRFSMKMY